MKEFSKSLLLVLIGFLAMPVSATTVTLIPSVTKVNTGEAFTVGLYMDASDSIGPNPGDIKGRPVISFSSSFVQYEGFDFNQISEPDPGVFRFNVTENADSLVADFLTYRYDSDADREDNLALLGVFSFTAVADAGEVINLGLSDSPSIIGTTFFNTRETINGIEGITFQGANVNVVPIPAAVWMFGSGLLGLLGWSRRRSAMAC